MGKAVDDGDQLDKLPGRRELHDLAGEGCAVDHVLQRVGMSACVGSSVSRYCCELNGTDHAEVNSVTLPRRITTSS